MWQFYEKSLKRLREKRNEYVSALSEGQAHSYDSYRFLCGKIQAFSEMEGILKDLLDSLQNKHSPCSEKKNVELY